MILLAILAAIMVFVAVAFTMYAKVTIKDCFLSGNDIPPYMWIVPAALWGLAAFFTNLLVIYT